MVGSNNHEKLSWVLHSCQSDRDSVGQGLWLCLEYSVVGDRADIQTPVTWVQRLCSQLLLIYYAEWMFWHFYN